MRLILKRFRRSERSIATAYHGVSLLVVAGITHLALILVAPREAAHDGYARVAALAGGAVLKTVAAPAGDRAVLPYADPSLTTAFCLYDLSHGPVAVSLDVGGASYAAVSMHSRRGIAYYGLTNRSASDDRKIALMLMTAAQIGAAEGDDAQGADLRIAAPEAHGFVMVQALAEGISARPGTEALVRTLSCTPATRP